MELNKIFKDGLWSSEINVRDFVSHNITPYYGDASFLEGPTERTKAVWNRCLEALAEERENNGVRSLDNVTVSTITSHKAGYIDKENELIVGLQTDELLKRAIKPFGGINVVSKACHENGVEVDDRVKDIFTHYRKTHNDGVFDVYTEEIRSFRSLGFLTGLPDNYARGRIIGDYRRMALYGIDRLIEAKKEDLHNLTGPMTEARIRLREEVAEQIKALKDMKVMGEYYGLDLSRPAYTAQEAVQWVYMAYLAAVKEQDGAAMSLGNVSSFLDIYLEYELSKGTITESFAQEPDRPVCHQTAYGPPPAYAIIQRHLCRRPDLGNQISGRTSQRRTYQSDKDLLPFPADIVQPRPFTGTEPDRTLEPGTSGRIQRILCKGFYRHFFYPVRK